MVDRAAVVVRSGLRNRYRVILLYCIRRFGLAMDHLGSWRLRRKVVRRDRNAVTFSSINEDDAAPRGLE